jgi:hypothetical protein
MPTWLAAGARARNADDAVRDAHDLSGALAAAAGR